MLNKFNAKTTLVKIWMEIVFGKTEKSEGRVDRTKQDRRGPVALALTLIASDS